MRKTKYYLTVDEARQAGLILTATRRIESAYIRQTKTGKWYIDDTPPPPTPLTNDDFYTWS
jgi:hypothetical protein